MKMELHLKTDISMIANFEEGRVLLPTFMSTFILLKNVHLGEKFECQWIYEVW